MSFMLICFKLYWPHVVLLTFVVLILSEDVLTDISPANKLHR